MKLRGRYVVEASVLIPYICILLVYVFYCTLYAHDYAVYALGAVESGVKSVYRNQSTDRQIEEQAAADLKRKLQSRLLWVREPEVKVQVNPVRIRLELSGAGAFLPVEGIRVSRTIYRIAPCEMLRRSRWLMK